MINKIKVNALAVGPSTCLTAANIGAHSARVIGEVTLHAHGDLLFELRKDVHGRIDALLRRNVLAKEQGPVAEDVTRELIPRWIGNRVHVRVQGGHGERRIPDNEACSGGPSSDVVELEEDVDEEEDDSGCRMRGASRMKRSR